MSSTPHTDNQDALATLVTRCRELREFADEVSIAPSAGYSFLRHQFEDALEDLTRSLGRLRGADGERSSSETVAVIEPQDRAPSFEGSSWTIPIGEFIGFLSTHRKSGVLWVTSPVEVFLVEFRQGQLIRASSDHSPEGQRLGDVLVAQGALPGEEVAALVEEARTAFKHFGTFLVETDSVSEEDVRHALRVQVQAIFFRLLRSENAIYRFQEGNELTDAHDLDLNVMGLLLEGARLIDENEHENGSSEALAALPD